MKSHTKKTPEKQINGKYEKSTTYYQNYSQYNPNQISKSRASNLPLTKKYSTKTSYQEKSKSKNKKQSSKGEYQFYKTSSDKKRLTQKSKQKFPLRKTFLPKRLCADSKYDELLARLSQLEQTNLSLCKQFTSTFIDLQKQIKKVNHKIGGITDDVAGIKIELKQNQQDINVLIQLISQQPNLSLEGNSNSLQDLTKSVPISEASVKRQTSSKKSNKG